MTNYFRLLVLMPEHVEHVEGLLQSSCHFLTNFNAPNGTTGWRLVTIFANSRNSGHTIITCKVWNLNGYLFHKTRMSVVWWGTISLLLSPSTIHDCPLDLSTRNTLFAVANAKANTYCFSIEWEWTENTHCQWEYYRFSYSTQIVLRWEIMAKRRRSIIWLWKFELYWSS